MEEFQLNGSRVRAFRAFIVTLATEFRARLEERPQDPVMQRRRTQCHWLLDRTSLCVAVRIIFEHRNDPELMLFLLVAVTYGFTTWKNVVLAGGLDYLKAIYTAFNAEEIARKWHSTPFVKKAYNTQTSLGALVLTDSWVDGLLRVLQHWKCMLGREVWRELYTQPGPSAEHTERVLKITGHLPPFVSLLTRRFLGLYDQRLYQERSSFEVGHGAIPVLDWLAGCPVAWENLKLYAYKPAFADQVYPKILERLTTSSQEWWASSVCSLLPAWVQATGQLFEGSACEKRKQLVEEHGGRMPIRYAPQEGYKELFDLFQSHFVRDGKVVCVASPPRLNAAALVPRRQVPEIRRPNMGGITLLFKNRFFKTLNDFCKQSGYMNTVRGPRAHLAEYKFQPADMLWFSRGCANNLSRQLDAEVRNGSVDLAGSDLEELCLVADLPSAKRRRVHQHGVLFYDLEKLQEAVAG